MRPPVPADIKAGTNGGKAKFSVRIRVLREVAHSGTVCHMKKLLFPPLLLAATLMLSGCILGAAVEVVGETVEAGVEVTGAVVDAAIPDGDDKEDD